MTESVEPVLPPATPAEATVSAAQGFSRRLMLARAAAIGVIGAAGPWIVRDARSSSGELNVLNWDDELPSPVIPSFTKATGIKVNTTPFSQNEEQINKLQATGGEGFDLCQPTHDRAPQFKDLGLLQPLDPSKKLDAGQRAAGASSRSARSTGRWDGKLYHTGHTWGSEAISPGATTSPRWTIRR